MTDSEPDYRFTLANERTFLAWIRTALALLAAGVAVGQLFTVTNDQSLHRVLGIVCIALATTIALGAFVRWRQVQSAMRRGDPLTSSVMARVLVGGFCAAAVACGILILS
ncbi:hypothetical protein AXA44_30885 [Rhodococcus sp. SC4]|nr:hypothetical protein AXA44_30885 [Rhodococcus sp. SC4]